MKPTLPKNPTDTTPLYARFDLTVEEISILNCFRSFGRPYQVYTLERFQKLRDHYTELRRLQPIAPT